MKKILSLMLIALMSISLVGCVEPIVEVEIEVELVSSNDVTIYEGETFQIDATTNDELGVTYATSDSAILSVTTTGEVEAQGVGEATITITSKTDNTISVTVDVTVRQVVTISIVDSDLTMTEGDVVLVNVTTDDPIGLEYVSSNLDIFVVTETGEVTAKKEGTATLTITSMYDESVYEEVTVIVDKLIVVDVTTNSLNLIPGDQAQIQVTANDNVSYLSLDTDVATVSETGLITAIGLGTVTIRVLSQSDPNIYDEFTVVVDKIITVDITTGSFVMVIGDESQIEATMNDDIIYETRNPDVITVSETGLITAVGFGTGTVRVKSTLKPDVYEEVTITVFKVTEEIDIVGGVLLVVGMNGQLSIDPSPAGAYTEVTWRSIDDTVVAVDEFGIVSGVSVGTTTIIATSVLDETIVDSIDIEVINVSVVDDTVSSGDTYVYEGVTLTYGERLYSSITDALIDSPAGTLILVEEGNYTEDITISNDGITLRAIGLAEFDGGITIDGDNTEIDGFLFTGNCHITNISGHQGLTFTNNTINNTNDTHTGFIALSGMNNVDINNNNFHNIATNAINISDFTEGYIYISNNVFLNIDNAIVIDAVSEYDITTEINIIRNDIDTVDTAFNIDLLYGSEQKVIEAIVRFNTSKNFTFGAASNEGNTIDFTLNHWGCVELDMAKFTNVTEYYLRGFYTLAEHIPTEAEVNPLYPILITVTNPIDEIMIGETHTFEYDILPMEMSDHPIKFITGNPELLAINQSGEITPLKSGDVYIQVRSGLNSSVRTEVSFVVITTPGIELLPSNYYNNIIVGDPLSLMATPFPTSYALDTVTYSSSDDAVATIDQTGVVTTLTEGLVTFTATLESDPTVTQEYTMYVYGSLDESNPLDYITMQQISYSTMHEWIAYGFAFNYADKRNESVSRYYFDPIEINQSKMLDVYYAIRPGALMDPLPIGITPYNDDNVHWIVVHDTASTASGSGALAHANWLYNSTINEDPLWVSWHFSIDDTFVYQHLPTNERGFHAGDGSTSPGEGSYLGGGNRNGIGIEMAVNQDGDMMRTWQRTAKLVVDLLVEYNMPTSQQRFHNDFSGKDCPNTLRNAGLVPLFLEFVEVEYKMATDFSAFGFTLESHNPDYLDNQGRIIQMPDRAITVSYTVTVTDGLDTWSRTFYTYIPGTVR